MRVLDERMLNTVTITAAGQSDRIECGHLANIGLFIKLVANGVNGTVKLQRSVDGENWTDTGDSLACVNGTATAFWAKVDECSKYLRVDYTHAADYTAYVHAYGKGF